VACDCTDLKSWCKVLIPWNLLCNKVISWHHTLIANVIENWFTCYCFLHDEPDLEVLWNIPFFCDPNTGQSGSWTWITDPRRGREETRWTGARGSAGPGETQVRYCVESGQYFTLDLSLFNMEVKPACSVSYLFKVTCSCSRPDSTFTWFMNPFKSLKYLLWNNYKMCLIKFLVIGLLVALMGLFFYSMPVRALLKYEPCKIRSLCSRVHRRWLVMSVSLLYSIS